MQQAVCGSMPADGQRIECTKPEGASGDIVIDAADIDIVTTEDGVRPIHVLHAGDGDIRVTLRNVDLHANGAHEQPFADALSIVHGSEAGRPGSGGDMHVDIQGGRFVTEGRLSHGIFLGRHPGSTGDIHLTVRDAVVITNSTAVVELPPGEQITESDGVLAANRGDGGDIVIDVARSRVATRGVYSAGIAAYRSFSGNTGRGDIVVRVSGGTVIETHGSLGDGVWARHDDNGDIVVDLRDVRITTNGYQARGVFALHNTPRVDDKVAGPRGGDIVIKAENVVIASQGTVSDSAGYTFAPGILAVHRSVGDIVIDLRGGRIETRGGGAHGIEAFHEKVGGFENDGTINIATRDGHSITTTGAGAHGIRALHQGTEETRTISVVAGGDIDVRGAGASGIAVGWVGQDWTVIGAAALDAGGYRRQTVTVDGRVVGGTGGYAAGIYLAGGDRVVIGPMGSVGARSGVAILALGDNVVDGRRFPRKLHVDLLPDGRPGSDLLDGIIQNDGGVTVFAVTGTVLYDSRSGPTGAWAANGARDVTLAEGFGGLDFSSADAFIDRWGPRAAVYEALPGVMLGLNGHGGAPTSSPRRYSADSPVWIRLDGARAYHEAGGRATVGARYDIGRAGLEVGVDAELGEHVTGTLGARHVTGSAKVSAPTGGGTAGATGYGLSGGLAWRGGASGSTGRAV